MSELRDADAVKALFTTVGPAVGDRPGGYTRIIKLGRRSSDSSEMVYLEWVDTVVASDAGAEATAAEA